MRPCNTCTAAKPRRSQYGRRIARSHLSPGACVGARTSTHKAPNHPHNDQPCVVPMTLKFPILLLCIAYSRTNNIALLATEVEGHRWYAWYARRKALGDEALSEEDGGGGASGAVPQDR